MQVKENMISFCILWNGLNDRVTDSQKTEDIVCNWLVNNAKEFSLVECGASKDGPIDLVIENYNSSSEQVVTYLRELINLFRANTEIERIWLKWNDVTDDFIWTDIEAKLDMNKNEHKKEDYILVHKKQ